MINGRGKKGHIRSEYVARLMIAVPGDFLMRIKTVILAV